MKKSHWIGVVLIAAILVPGLLFGKSKAQVAYPEGYQSWTRVKSMIILEGHVHFNAFGGFHHVYANDKALESLKNRKPFAKGSVLVFELFESIVENNAITEGPRQVIGVMEKDPNRFTGTKGWGFEDFKLADPNQRSVTNMRDQCFSCHESQKANDYVFSTYRK
jgi:hypothetical protein